MRSPFNSSRSSVDFRQSCSIEEALACAESDDVHELYGSCFLELDFDQDDFEPVHPEEIVALDLAKYATYFLTNHYAALDTKKSPSKPSHDLAFESAIASATSLHLLHSAASNESLASSAARDLHGHRRVPTVDVAPTPKHPSIAVLPSTPHAWLSDIEDCLALDDGTNVTLLDFPAAPDAKKARRASSALPSSARIYNHGAVPPRMRKDSLPRKFAQKLRGLFNAPGEVPPLPSPGRLQIAAPMRRALSASD